MKNLMIWIHPEEKFDEEHAKLVKIQIENSLEFWKPEDIILITNFPYDFMGIRPYTISGEYHCKLFRQSTKIDVMVHLFDIGFIKEGILYWLHDWDAYQQAPITKEELELDGFDIGMTDYGRNERWNGGSMFIKKGIEDFYREVKDKMYRDNEKNKGIWKNEEDVFMELTADNAEVNKRIKRMNITYNFGIKRMKECYEKSAHKPPKVLHFHPERRYRGWGRAFDIAKGNNELGFPIMTPRLINIFNKYGYT